MSAAGLGTVFRRRLTPQPRAKAGRGVSPHFVVMGLQAWTAQMAAKALSIQQDAVKATDAHAKMIEAAQKSETRFRDRSGNTRSSVSTTKRASAQGYEVSVGPDWPTKGPPVARFLVFGTVKMSPKWDVFGLSQPYINSWQQEMERLVRL